MKKLIIFLIMLVCLSSITYATVTTDGTITTDGAYTIVTFTSSGSFQTTTAINVSYLVVAGGGGGCMAGAGAGGLLYNSLYEVTPNTYTVTVGTGAAGKSGGYDPGYNGGNSVFANATSIGGGGGGCFDIAGSNGGSGGAEGWSASSDYSRGTGIAGQGYIGGYSAKNAAGGGGGGAGAAGGSGSGTVAGAGGIGLAYDITGTSTYYAGGGGGGKGGTSGGLGGLGGGGNGGIIYGSSGTAGTDGLGGGGGAANDMGTGGDGGDGVVIIKYLSTLTVNWDGLTPTDNTFNYQENLNFNFNFTGDGLSNANCTFYENGTSIGTMNNINPDTNYIFTQNHTRELEINNTYYIECAGDNGLYDNSSTKTIEWSLVTPFNNYIGSNFNGLIDNFNIFDSALSQEELYALYLGEQIPIVKSNLSTSSILWPALSFDINVSLLNDWNGETASCSLIDNASFVSCLPASASVDESNSTTFTCTATERNTEDVGIYAQCTSASYLLKNTSIFTYSITADSNPVIDTNFSISYNLFTLEALSLNITGYNWTEGVSSCAFTYNDTGLTCLDIGLIDDTSYQYSNITTCTPDYIQTKNYQVNITCDGTLYTGIQSSDIITIDADSNPNQESNVSGSVITDYTLSGFDILVSEINWYEQATCALVFNDTGVTCNSTLINDSADGTISCVPDYVQEKNYNIGINCNSTLYPNINSTVNATFTLDANSNPTLAGNFTDLVLSLGETFDILVTGTNFYENTNTCVFIWNDSIYNSQCPSFNITANQTNPSYTTVTCTEGYEESKINDIYIQCNGTLYENINSTTYTVIYDSVDPLISLVSPNADNTTVINTTDTFQFDFTCSHPAPVNISTVSAFCVNETGDIVYGETISTDLLSYNFNEITSNFSYSNNFMCEMNCTDYFGLTNVTTANITAIIGLNASNTNLSSYTKVNGDFDVNMSFNFAGDNASCTIISNSSLISCTTDTGASPLTSTCSPSSSIEENVTFYQQCNNTIRTYIISTGPISNQITVDIVLPRITINNPPESGLGKFFNVTPVLINVSFYDPNLFAYNLTCYNKSTGEVHYSRQDTNIANQTYSIADLIYFNASGIEECNATVADGHTDNKYDADINIDTEKLGIGVDKLVITKKDEKGIKKEKSKVEIVWDKKSDVELDSITFEKKEDRVSPIFNTVKPVKPETCDKYPDNKKCVAIKDAYINIYWDVKFDGSIINREDISGIPGHIILIPDNNFYDAQWYDAVDEYSDSIVSFDIKDKEVNYHLKIPYKDYYKEDGEKVKTKSIGGLNVNSQIWNFTILNSVVTTFNAYNIYNGTPILKFNISLTNSSGQTNYLTTNGTIEINMGPANTTLLISSDDYLNNYSIFSSNTNISAAYNLSMWEATLAVSVVNLQDLSLVSGVTTQVSNNTINFTNSSNPSIFYLNKNDYIINISGSTITDNSTNYTISALGNYQYTFNVFSNFTFRLMDEATVLPFNMSSPDKVTQYTYCTDTRVFSSIISNNTGALSIPCTYDKIKFVVDYPTDRYYRTLLPRAINVSLGNLTIWLVNLDTTQIIYNTFEIYSLIEEYQNLKVYFKKFINEQEYIITSDFIDVESKIGTYLMLSEEYTVEVEADNLATRNMGFYSADAAGDKIIRLFEIGFNSDPTGFYEDNSWWVETDNSTVPNRAKITYLSTDVDSATLNVYNESTEGTLLYSTTVYTDSGIIYYLPEIDYENYTFMLGLNITKDAGTSNNVNIHEAWRANANIILDLITFGYISKQWLGLFLILVLSVIALIFSAQTADIGIIIYIGMVWFFTYLGWLYVSKDILGVHVYYISTAALGLGLIVAVINFLKKKDLGRI